MGSILVRKRIPKARLTPAGLARKRERSRGGQPQRCLVCTAWQGLSWLPMRCPLCHPAVDDPDVLPLAWALKLFSQPGVILWASRLDPQEGP